MNGRLAVLFRVSQFLNRHCLEKDGAFGGCRQGFGVRSRRSISGSMSTGCWVLSVGLSELSGLGLNVFVSLFALES